MGAEGKGRKADGAKTERRSERGEAENGELNRGREVETWRKGRNLGMRGVQDSGEKKVWLS